MGCCKRETKRSDRTSTRTRGHSWISAVSGAACFLCSASTASLAQASVSPPGRLLASNCSPCHGTSDTAPGFERLTGKSANKLLKELRRSTSPELKAKASWLATFWVTRSNRCAISCSGCRSSVEGATMDRRSFLITSAAALAVLPGPGRALAPPGKPKARVIVIGGGMGGATMAKYMRLWGRPGGRHPDRAQSEIRLEHYEQLLTGQRTMPSLMFGYEALRSRYGVEVIIDEVTEVDSTRAAVKLGSGKQLNADRIVMAPGIDFDPVPGLADGSRMPHAWQAGPQTTPARAAACRDAAKWSCRSDHPESPL